MLNIGTRVEILPRFDDLGAEIDDLGRRVAWVLAICPDGDVCLEVQGMNDEIFVTARRVRIA